MFTVQSDNRVKGVGQVILVKEVAQGISVQSLDLILIQPLRVKEGSDQSVLQLVASAGR